MERLTYKSLNIDRNGLANGFKWENTQKAADKLSDYEDTGLSPKQVAEMKAENERLIKELSQLARESVEREKNLAKLEAEVEYWKPERSSYERMD